MFDICDLADGAGFTGCVGFLIQSASLYFDKNSDGKIYIYVERERAVDILKCSRKISTLTTELHDGA